MLSREIVQRAIEFRNPERVPYNFDSNRLPEIPEKYGDDFEWVFASQNPNFKPRVNDETQVESELGIIYSRLGKTCGEATEYPLEDITKVDQYKLPDYSESIRYADMESIVEAKPDKYILGMFPHFMFLVMLDICGFENLMISFHESPEEVEKLADMLMESCLTAVDNFADRGANGMIAIEDLGLQSNLIIAPDMWRKIFKPRMQKIIDRVHERDMHFFIHSCGDIIEVIDDFIEIGVDVLQIDQQHNMGIQTLKERYAGRICFFCPVDIQTVLPSGTPEIIESEVKELIDAFGSKAGGFMAKTYPQPEAIDLPEANTKLMCELFKKHGVYTTE